MHNLKGRIATLPHETDHEVETAYEIITLNSESQEGSFLQIVAWKEFQTVYHKC